MYLHYQGNDLYQTMRCSTALTRSTLNVERSDETILSPKQGNPRAHVFVALTYCTLRNQIALG